MLKRLHRVGLLLAAFAAPQAAWAQSTLLQGGAWTLGHLPAYNSTGGSQPIVIDSGPAGNNTLGQGVSELNLTARGTGAPPFAGQGTGIDGTIFQIQDAVSTNATGYHYLSMSANAQGGGLIEYGAIGSAPVLPFTMKINGVSYQFPFSNGGVLGPVVSAVNGVACWNNTIGTLLKDCGPFPLVAGTTGQIQYNNAGALGAFTLQGDASVNTTTGVLTITSIGGKAVTLGGPLTTVGASTLTLTTTAPTSVTLPLTGTLSTLAGVEALTNKTYNGNTWTPGTGILTIAAAKTLTASNTITLSGTDGSTLNIGSGGTLGTAAYTTSIVGTQLTNSMTINVALNNTGLYFTGPQVTQGGTGVWFASGAVSVNNNTGGANFNCKLWDGTTVIDSRYVTVGSANDYGSCALSGFISAPVGNIRISVNSDSASSYLPYNQTGWGKDGTLTVFRVQ